MGFRKKSSAEDLATTPTEGDVSQYMEGGQAGSPKKDVSFPSLIPALSGSLFLVIAGAVGLLLFSLFIVPFFLTDEQTDKNTGDYKLIKRVEFWAIPIVSVVFTYFHIWLALWMTFYPIEFKGYMQLKDSKTWANVGLPGWQGIVPSKAEKMARTAVKLMTTKLLNVKEMFGKVEPMRVAAELGPMMEKHTPELVDAIANKYNATLWGMIPSSVKKELIEKILEDSPPIIARMMDDVKENIEDIFDLEEMIVNHSKRHPELLNDMFISCGYSELKFIRNSGATMGFIFGVIQLAIFIVAEIMIRNAHPGEKPASHSGPMLILRIICFPVIGLLVGSLTNFIALAAIFRPVEPIYICGIKLHGLFLRHQKEVAEEYARIAARDFLNPQNIAEAMIKGRCADVLVTLIYTHIESAVDERFGKLQPIVRVTMGSAEYDSMREDFSKKVVELLPISVNHLQDYVMEALEVQRTLEESVGSLPSREFEELLHPVFQEDEWKLILLGGVLGVVIGIAQIYMV